MADLTAKEFADWIPAREALASVAAAMEGDFGIAADTLTARLRDKIIRACANLAVIEQSGKLEPQKSLIFVEPEAWNSPFDFPSNGDSFWQSGDITMLISNNGRYESGGNILVRYFGVRFDPAGMADLLPKSLTIASTTSIESQGVVSETKGVVSKHPGGRPRKDFWDDLIIEMCRRIWLGDFKPNTQSEVETEMLEWAAKRDHELSPTSVKIPAKKIFRAFK